MASIVRSQPAGNAGPIAARPQVAPPPPRPEKDWVVRTPQSFLSAKASPYSPRVRLMMLILDGHCRGLSYTWYGNASLAEEFGCEVRNLKALLVEMEGLGLILRVIAGQGRKARLGIVMRKRADPDLPAAETDEELADAIARLKARREAGTGRFPAPTGGQETAPSKGQKTAPELRSSSRDDPSSDEAGPGEALAPRPRREQPRADAAPPARPGGEPAAAAAPVPAPPGFTAGQVEFLGALSPDQRARFDGWGPGKRAQALGAHAGGFDPAALRMVLADLGTAPPPPMPGPEAGPAELVAALAGRMGPSLLARCSNALMVTLGDRGGSKSYGAMLKLCGQVIKGERAPESLVGPLAKTLARLDRGEAIGNPAAYWTRAVQEWDREHSRPEAGRPEAG